MAIPLAAAEVALISIIGVGIFKVVEGDHDRAFLSFFLDPFFSKLIWRMHGVIDRMPAAA